MSTAVSANLEVLGGQNGSKSTVLVLCKATPQAPPTLFGQSLCEDQHSPVPIGQDRRRRDAHMVGYCAGVREHNRPQRGGLRASGRVHSSSETAM